jgi:ankyrin repeat protein
MNPVYNDLLFEIYHFIRKDEIARLNKASRRMHMIWSRIRRYIYIYRFSSDSRYVDMLYDICRYGEYSDIKKLVKENRHILYLRFGFDGLFVRRLDDKHNHILKLLIKNIDDKNGYFIDHNYEYYINYVLHYSSMNENIKYIRYMLKLGGDINCGFNAACYTNNIKMMRFLRKNGATKCSNLNCHQPISDHMKMKKQKV